LREGESAEVEKCGGAGGTVGECRPDAGVAIPSFLGTSLRVAEGAPQDDSVILVGRRGIE